MEDHKTLFKSQSSALSPRNHNKINRERQRVARTKKREECFQSNRQMDASPSATPIEKAAEMSAMVPHTPKAAANVGQENQHPETAAATGTAAAAAAGGTANKSTFETRKANYLQRYIKWKAENRHRAPHVGRTKKLEQAEQQPAAEVFVPPKRQSIYVVIDPKTSKAAEIQRMPLEEPINLANPPVSKLAKQPVGAAHKEAAPGAAAKTVKRTPGVPVKPTNDVAQKSTARAVVKPTRPTPAVATKETRPASAVKPTITTTIKPKIATTTVKPSTIAKKPLISSTAAKQTPGVGITVKKPWQMSTAPKPVLHSVPAAGSVTTPATATRPKPAVSIKKPFIAATAPRTSRPINLMTQPFDKPAIVSKLVKPLRGGVGGGVAAAGGGGGAGAKFKTATTQKPRRSQAPSDLSRPMKIKKGMPNNSKQKLVEKIPNYKKELLKIATEDPLPETPIDLESIENPFHAQATSTQCKPNNCSENLLEAYRDITKLSPVSVTENTKNEVGSLVKRQLIPGKKSEEKPTNKFNFVRYSEGYSLLESPTSTADELDTVMPSATVDNSMATEDAQQTLVPAATAEDPPQTPPTNSNGRPNYLSPFVSVSRGKVNSQTERKKRDSMYLQEEGKQQPETPVAVRRTLDAVQYFRMQLDNEIERLQKICTEWLTYCDQHEEMLIETGGKDMIDAAIGQTNLLTTKKLQQFGSLIDRCEAGATGVGLRPNDGSEATKPVLADDLEGWWDMMRLQSDNVDKRFNNLARWKANNWQDPDVVVKPKIKAKPAKAKPKLSTAKASSNLMSFLRKAKAEKKNKQADGSQLEENLTPTRRIIVVRDRKSFSPARTVLRLSIGSGGGRTSTAGNVLLKSALMGAAAEQKTRQSTSTPPQAPPLMTPRRMSILKTPGTNKKRDPGSRGVMFSAKKNVRRFEFAVEEGQLSGDDEDAVQGIDKLEDCEEDMSMEKSSTSQNASGHNTVQAATENPPTPDNPNFLRTCQLRNRKVKIRPSSEFM